MRSVSHQQAHVFLMPSERRALPAICFEEFSFRSGSYVSLSVMLVENEENQEAIVSGFGGGGGLLNISFGANKSIANRAVKILNEFDFVEVS